MFRAITITLLFSALLLIKPAFAQEQTTSLTIDKLPTPSPTDLEQDLDHLSTVKYLPNQFPYKIIILKEKVQRLLLTTNSKKAYFDVINSGKRLKETYQLLQKQDQKNTLGSLIAYQKQLDVLNTELKTAQENGEDLVNTYDLLSDNLIRHQDLIAQILNKSDDQNLKSNLNLANEQLIKVVKVIEKARPEDAKKILSRYEKK